MRRALADDQPAPSPEEVAEARIIVEHFRSAHVSPMEAARRGLTSCIRTEGLDAEVSQRLKRMPTIVDKLTRVSRRLSTLVDIGGCRAILANQDDVYRVQERFMRNSLRRNGKEDKEFDYVASPQKSGYRAVHIHTTYQDRKIEVQFRTRWQHLWAKYVEDLTGWADIDFKNEHGPAEALQSLQHLSVGLAHFEANRFGDDAFMDEVSRLLRETASAILRAHRRSLMGRSR